jgi:acyl-[acyl carrier protein]--UDP-N-acetylglucosamine O-acyltransferase
LGIVECRNFCSVTVTGHLCQSVELIQHVTVTGVCQIERNGTVHRDVGKR